MAVPVVSKQLRLTAREKPGQNCVVFLGVMGGGFKHKRKKNLGGPVKAGNNSMFGPALVHELPVEGQLCSRLNFTTKK